MKKIILPFALALFATSILQAQPVYSNTVGMVKIDVPARSFVFVGVPFEAEGPIGLDDLIGDQLTGGPVFGRSDNITVWDTASSTYKLLFKDSATGKWVYNVTKEPADIEILPGSGFWIQSRTGVDQTVVLSGNVPEDDKVLPIADGFNQYGFPYPVEMSVNDPDFALAAAATGGIVYGRSDNLMIWDVETSTYSLLWKGEGLTGDNADKNGKWLYQGTFDVATNTIKPGQGFWFFKRKASNNDWEPQVPYNLED